jgi:hypothetical protein
MIPKRNAAVTFPRTNQKPLQYLMHWCIRLNPLLCLRNGQLNGPLDAPAVKPSV